MHLDSPSSSFLSLFLLTTPGNCPWYFRRSDPMASGMQRSNALTERGWIGTVPHLSQQPLVCCLQGGGLLKSTSPCTQEDPFQGLLGHILNYVALILMFQWVISLPQRLSWELLLARMKGKEEGLPASKNSRRETCVQTPTSAHHIHSKRFLNPPHPARVF